MLQMKYRQMSQPRFKEATSLRQQLCIKTVSIHSYSQLKDLEENLLSKEPIMIIARITPIASKHPEAATKLVNKIYSKYVENNYSVFRLGGERIMVIPNSVRVEGFKSNIKNKKRQNEQLLLESYY